jgi:pyruvate/2-oxoglutarate dehydrogenase complex dihydrolipoamide acyltransferase (E2) component
METAMKPFDQIGNFEEADFPRSRNPTIDTLAWGHQRHHIPILLEIDVTEARDAIHAHKIKSGQRISFTSWVVKCIAQAVSEHKYVHALRKGRRRLIMFDDVDVVITIERAAGTDEALPMPYIIRKANEKTVAAIHAEIRAAQKSPVPSGEVQIGSLRSTGMTQIFTMMPQFLRNLFFWQPVLHNPLLFKRTMGTVSVSSLTSFGMIGQGGMSWGIPMGIHPLMIAVGGIAKRPGIIHEQMVIREYVGLTVLFDHDVTDGAPVARFIRRLQELMTSQYGLEEAPDVCEP